MRSRVCGTSVEPPDEKTGKRDGDQPPGKVVGMGSSPYRDFEPRYPVPRPVVPNSKPRPAAMTCCPPHVPPIRSGTELAYVIANPQVEHRELRPSPIIAHPKVGGPAPARITILTDGRSCSAPRNRQHTSTLPGGARPENYRTGPESGDKFAETDVADVVNEKRLTLNL